MVNLDYSFELNCDKKEFFHVLTDYQNLINYMPRQLQKIETIEENGNCTIIKPTIFFRRDGKKLFRRLSSAISSGIGRTRHHCS